MNVIGNKRELEIGGGRVRRRSRRLEEKDRKWKKEGEEESNLSEIGNKGCSFLYFLLHICLHILSFQSPLITPFQTHTHTHIYTYTRIYIIYVYMQAHKQDHTHLHKKKRTLRKHI